MKDLENANGAAHASPTITITWNVTLPRADCFRFSGLFAQADDEIDSHDFLVVEYRRQGASSWTPILEFLPDSEDRFRLANEAVLLPAARLFTAELSGLNSIRLLKVRLRVSLDARNADVAVDAFLLETCQPMALTTAPLALTSTMAVVSTSKPTPAPRIVFFESFDTSAAMSLSPVFNEDQGGDYFGLTGGTVSDFGPDWDGDMSKLSIENYTGMFVEAVNWPIVISDICLQALTAAIL
jgi:hypothetical protein